MPINLRPDQQQVVTYRRGYMAVPAVPGAGKTTVLAWLTADLIAEGAQEPGRILIVTYTNSAVGNFRSRISQYLDERKLPPHQGYEVRTIHSLAMQIVRERPEALGWADTFRIVDEVRMNGLLEALTAEWIARNRPLWESLLREELKGSFRERALEHWEQRTRDLFRSLIQAFKSRKLPPETAHRLTRHLRETSVLRWAAEVYVDYQRHLALEGAVDFGDLMLGAHQLLSRDGELLERLRRRWTYIFEDEAQDSYRLQEEVLKLLAGPEGNLVRVGDANQAIMGTFTSAEPDLFRRFCREEHVAYRPLTMASRSSRDIIELANELVRWSREEHPEREVREALEAQYIQPVPPDCIPANPQPPTYTIVTRTYENYEREIQAVAVHAARTVARSPEKTVAVLLPTNAMVQQMLELLKQQGVEARQLGGPTSPERLQTARDLLAVMAYLARPHRPELLVKAVGHLVQLDPAEEHPAAEALRSCAPEELFFPADGRAPFEALYAACPECREDGALREALEHLRRWLSLSLLPPAELTVALAAEMGLAAEELAVAHYVAVRAQKLARENPASDLEAIVGQLEGEMQVLGRFADTVHDRVGFSPRPGVVYVTTCHSAKGLEWDTVFLAALTRGEYPSMVRDRVRSEYWFLQDEVINPEALAQAELVEVLGDSAGTDPVRRAKLEIIGERLRLLYVGLTRARENLMLSYHQRDRWDRPAHPTLAFLHLKRLIDGRQREGRA